MPEIVKGSQSGRDPSPEHLRVAVERWLREAADAVEGLDDEVAEHLASKLLTLCQTLPAQRVARSRTHVLSISGDPAQRVAAYADAARSLERLACTNKPDGCPVWITPELIESTLDAFQRRYTSASLALLTPDDAVEIICNMSALIEFTR
ncbi:MAG: hypothetical protein DPW14_04455 [Planctomycetes bacterium]|nr:hypothetical protein [Planctomycetota bacterium]